MNPMVLVLALLVPFFSVRAANTATTPSGGPSSEGDKKLVEYFRVETGKLEQRSLGDIRTLEDWQSRRVEYRRQLQEMLGLWPMPERTDLKAVITGKLEQEDFTVEKLHFQAMPGLYVTANLYLPKKLEKPAPAILYVCGHGRMVTNGVSSGNKSWYQHHGAWFARNGYVCLLIDTVQLGEIEGLHHGTYREGQWWWNARGYTPAGVEAWFGIRALDYLCTRAEVDKERIGMTGRSGGGSYTWTVAALDDRVKVAAPVAGMTDLRNQVVDGVVEGHCDCMFFLNTYRWDFPRLAALIAPRPLLIANSDKDTIFPLDGVTRLYCQTRRIYSLYGETNKLGLLITEGPHADTQDLQLPVFRWFNRFLKREDPLIEMAAKKFCAPEQLRAFDRLPEDQRNTKIQEVFVPEAKGPTPVPSEADWMRVLREQVFGGWPDDCGPVEPRLRVQANENGMRCQTYDLSIQPGVDLCLYVLMDARVRKPEKTVLTVLDAESWANSPAKFLWLGGGTAECAAELRWQMQEQKQALVFFAPRGVEPTIWSSKPAKLAQIRRRYMLLGQTLDSMRVWDIRCAAQALATMPQFQKTAISVRAKGSMGVNAAYAALFEPEIRRLELQGLPKSHREGPDYLNVLKVWDIPKMLEVVGRRVELISR